MTEVENVESFVVFT